MANLILPVNIPQQSGTTKPSMFNLKINNGQLSTENKGTITVLRESKTTNSTTHPPPLHPIAKMSLLNANKGNSNSIDSIKITENPDSAVITPIPKKEDSQPEKRKKTISNILRGSTEKRLKKQNITKSQDSLTDPNYSLSSPESEQDKDKKAQNDDDITLIKVIPSEDKVSKLTTNVDDDIKIEIIKTPTNCNVETVPDNKSEVKSESCEETKEQLNTLNQNNTNFDASKVLDWKDGVGTLPGSNLQVKIIKYIYNLMIYIESNIKKRLNIFFFIPLFSFLTFFFF
ncbi:hypothetical protein PUN28_016865 [Cardiocondyla obscurior]|uniref:Uncharacterized protein n=1 Tax=Cardiocondyla obscurior TaxID=286306 RepID=A0AAW2ER88_9HYME